MRTTLDIDDDVLQAAKELAERERTTAGKVLSELARRGIICRNSHREEDGDQPFIFKDGLPVLRARGRIVTNEMISRIQEEIDEEDARAAGCELSPRPAG
jgi:predicted transcriptional regulator